VTTEFAALLTDADREGLERIGRRQHAERGDVLLARGDTSDHVLVLLSGRVKVVVPTGTGADSVLTFRGPGSLLGDLALVDQSPRSANVVAVEPVELIAIAASAFRAYLDKHPQVALAMLASLSAKLRESDRRLTEFIGADALGRICARLVELCEIQGDADASGPVQISLPITQEELAGWTGSSLESTAKALRSLRSLGWIATGRRAIEVRDLAALRERAP
jgi:CRP/FNR family cyclic AMP-dependent transcriptional regulator